MRKESSKKNTTLGYQLVHFFKEREREKKKKQNRTRSIENGK